LLIRWQFDAKLLLACSADSLVCCFADRQSAGTRHANPHLVLPDVRGLATRDTAGWAACATIAKADAALT